MNLTLLSFVVIICSASVGFGEEPRAAVPFGPHPYTTSGIFVESANDGLGTSPDTPANSPALSTPALTTPALTIKEKLVRCTKATFGPIGLLADAVGAGYDQLTNTPHEWGQGGQAYAERFGSQFGISFVDDYTEFALAAALHEDPRYYPSADASFHARLKSVFKQTLVKKTDSGGQRFAFAEFGGAIAGGFASNAWLPRSDNSAGDALETAAVLIARDFAFNLVREFIPRFRHIQ